jgi:hypothetical protein
MRSPGQRSWRGWLLQFPIRAVFLFQQSWNRIRFGRRGESARQDRSASAQEASNTLSCARRHPATPRVSERPAEWLWPALAFHLANAAACRFDELVRLTWDECQWVGGTSSPSASEARGVSFKMCPSPALECGAARVEGYPGGFLKPPHSYAKLNSPMDEQAI